MSNKLRSRNREQKSKTVLPNSSLDRTSLLPFLHKYVQQPNIGYYLSGIYFITIFIVALLYHNVGDYNVETDFFWSYVPQAKSALQGIFTIEGFRGPAYPIVLAIFGKIIGDFFRAGILISVLSAAGVLFFAYRILYKLFRPDIALIGTVLIAVNRTFIQYSYTASTDMFFNFLVTVSLFFLVKNTEHKQTDLIISAILAAIAYLTRYNGIFIILAIPIILLLVNPFNLILKERIKSLGIYLAVFFAVISPWGIYCLLETGSFFYNQNYLNIAYEMFAKGKMGWDHFWNIESQKYNSLFQVIFMDPILFIKTIIKNIFSHYLSNLELLLLLPLGIVSTLGVFAFIKEKPTKQQFSLLIYGASFFSVLLLVFYGERFSMFLILIYAVLAVKALTWRKLSSIRFWNRVQIGALVSLFLIIWNFADAYSFNKSNINSGPQEIPIIVDWFKKNYTTDVSENQIVVARKPHIGYYLGLTWTPFPYVQTEQELQNELHKLNATYLYIGVMEAYMRPQFREWLNPQKAPNWLIPVTYTLSPPAVLYKIKTGVAE